VTVLVIHDRTVDSNARKVPFSPPDALADVAALVDVARASQGGVGGSRELLDLIGR
jgi:3-deoxy-D-manno-octulosonate 8-phosphate phosphatase KdsC-like HAD superfamily phosphatase